MPLPPLLAVADIHERLQTIFPEGTANRNYVTREIAAKTVFVMLYIGAVEGTECWLRPDQVTRMTDAQAALAEDQDREAWLAESMRPTAGYIEGQWYAANTREPIRDETLREGLVRMGAVKEREGLPTTSPQPRYALAEEFVRLFDSGLTGEVLQAGIEEWQRVNLSTGALARVAIMRRGAVAREGRVLVTFPSGETRQMEPGPSSVISRAVVEEFAPRFFEQPGVIWLSESRNQVVARDDRLAQDMGVPPKLIIFNGFLVGAGAQHCQGQIRQRDRFATTMTIPTRNGDFGVTRAGSEWPAPRAHSTACPNA